MVKFAKEYGFVRDVFGSGCGGGVGVQYALILLGMQVSS